MTFINASCVTIKCVWLLCVTMKTRMLESANRKQVFHTESDFLLLAYIELLNPL